MLHLRKDLREIINNSISYLKLVRLNMKAKVQRDLEETVSKECLRPLHFVPNLNNTNYEAQSTIKKFIQSKNTLFDEIVSSEYANPFPFVVTSSLNSQYKSIHNSLFCAIKSLVFNYYRDPRIQGTFKFTSQVQNILEICQKAPYVGIGGYRPDFVHQVNDCVPKLCEINARFPTNGYFITYYGYDILKTFENRENNLETFEGLANIPNKLVEKFDMCKPIGILKEKEHGYDVHFIKSQYPNIYFIKPNEIIFEKESKKVSVMTDNGLIEFDQFILELHQDEVLALPLELVEHIVSTCKYYNDFRTIFIVHDKRFLTLLSRDDILCDYLEPIQHEIIQKHRIKSVLPSHLNFDNKLKLNIINQKDKWLIKPCLLGKGKGIIFGKNVTQNEWQQIVDDSIQRNHVIFQEYIQQEEFKIYKGSKSNGQNFDEMKVVGTLLCHDDDYLGPGIYRCSKKDLIALSQGGSFIYPVEANFSEYQNNDFSLNDGKSSDGIINGKIIKYVSINGLDKILTQYNNHKMLQVPSETIFSVPKFSLKDAAKYEKALKQYGIAIFELLFEDPNSEFLLMLANYIGKPIAHTSKGDDYLWDIKAKQKEVQNEQPCARSHLSHEFLLHTDASFEKTPPRFVSLHYLREDKLNGGLSIFVKLDDVLSNMSKEEIELLSTKQLVIKIPAEFRKPSEPEFIKGCILGRDGLGDALCRFRSDIIINKEQLDEDLRSALKKFEDLTNIENSKLISYCHVKSNSIVIIDNCRWLHGRTEIKDPERHLRRIRFQTKYTYLQPIFSSS